MIKIINLNAISAKIIKFKLQAIIIFAYFMTKNDLESFFAPYKYRHEIFSQRKKKIKEVRATLRWDYVFQYMQGKLIMIKVRACINIR